MTGRFTQADNFQLDYTNYQSFKEKTNPNNPVLANRDKAREEKQNKLKEFLGKPQNLNIYSYGLNNPLRYTDPSGQSVKDVVKQVWSGFCEKNGPAAEYLYNNSNLAKTMMDHPYATGAAIGVGTGLAAYGAVAGMTWLGLIAPAAGQEVMQQADKVNNAIDFTTRFGQNLGTKMNEVQKLFQKEGLNFDPHLAQRTVERFSRGITPEKVIDTVRTGEKYFDILKGNYSYFKNGIRVAEELNGLLKTVVTQNNMSPDRFIKLFQ